MDKQFRIEKWQNYNTSSSPCVSADRRIKVGMETIRQGNVSWVSVNKRGISHAHKHFEAQSSSLGSFNIQSVSCPDRHDCSRSSSKKGGSSYQQMTKISKQI